MIMKKILLLLAVLFCSLIAANAQYSIEYALDKVVYRTLPFSNEQTKSIHRKWPIKNTNNIIPDKLYTNFQLSEYFLARESALLQGNNWKGFRLTCGTCIKAPNA